jgi:hypothetical protein
MNTKGALSGGVMGAFLGAATGWLVTGGSKLAAIGGGTLGALVVGWVNGSGGSTGTGTAGLPAGIGSAPQFQKPQWQQQQPVRR